MSTLDELMSRDPLDLTDQDIKDIVTYHRSLRARLAAGEKPAKPTSAETLDISGLAAKILGETTTSKPKFVRRF